MPPEIDADESGNRAVQQYDVDNNGTLSKKELVSVPGLLTALKRYDADRDGTVSATEIAQRIRLWQASRFGIMTLRCRVTLDSRPLPGATIRFVPEAFLGESIRTATGIADPNGWANIGIDTSDLPADQQQLVGVQCGIYRIEITHPEVPIDESYNVGTTFGQEVAPDLGLIGNLVLPLKSR
jgi:hypothetical protein